MFNEGSGLHEEQEDRYIIRELKLFWWKMRLTRQASHHEMTEQRDRSMTKGQVDPGKRLKVG